jgi:CHAT domain-containing protein
MKRFFWFFLVCLGCTGQVAAQNTDSLAVAKMVDSLTKVGRSYLANHEFDKALEANMVSEKAVLETTGRESKMYCRVSFIYGQIYYYKSQYIEAEEWLLKALDLQLKFYGRETTGYANIVEFLGSTNWQFNNFEKTEFYYREAMNVREKLLGKNNPSYGQIVGNLGNVRLALCQYEKAEPLFVESCNALKATQGPESTLYATMLTNLSNLYISICDYGKAEDLLIASKDILKKKINSKKDTWAYAHNLINLGNFYRTMGDYGKALPILIESKTLQAEISGKAHTDYAEAVLNLAYLYSDMDNDIESEHMYLEAKNIWENSIGKENQKYAQCLNDLGGIYQSKGNLKNAEEMFLESKSIQEKILGKEHPSYAYCLNNLGIFYKNRGQYRLADSLFLQEGSIIQKPLGKHSPQYVEYLTNLVNLYLITNNYPAARPPLLESISIQESLIRKAARHLSVRELSLYNQKFIYDLNRIYSFASLQPDLSPSCYDNALFLKGFLQNAAIRVNHPTLPDSSTTEQYYLFKSLHRRLAAEYAKPIAERKNVEELENRANDLEKELARKIAGYGEALRQVKWQEVQAALKPGEAAIEFVHYQYWNKKETDSTLYAALVLRPGMAQPLFVPLFEEKQLESLLAPNGQTPDLFYKNLYSWEGKGQTLRQLVWQPLEAALSGAKTVYFAPSGLLHRLNLGAIPSAAKATVGDHYRVVGLNSTRNVGRVSNPADVATDVSTTTAALFGGIQYDMDSTAVLREQAKFSPEKNNTLRGQLDFAQSDSTLRGGAWRYLPGSEKEVAEVEKIMANAGIKAQVFKGFSGSEARFKAMSKPSPRILHLATHGFFFPDPKAAPIKTGPDDQVVFKNSDHPLIRSGLVLAGGNYAWQTGKPLKSSVEDGILTAYEISQIDLSQTELVVLSACETGLGDIKGSEGIYGLQRAFKIAGAKRVLMSLWQVPDQQTSRLMGLFYKNWLSDKMPVGDALQAAKNTLRDRGYDPFYWAGFVLVE